ncbi:LysE family translocator [Colwelliaceae bacterium 6471]
MDITQILGFTLVALLLVVSPGPNGLLIAKTVPTQGKKAGMANVIGFLCAFYLHGALSILGISVILMKSAEAFFIVKIIGAMYLSWIGIKSLINAFKNNAAEVATSHTKTNNSLVQSYLEGFLTNALNPKVSMFYLAAFPQFIPAGENAVLYGFILVTIHSLMNMAWFTSMVLLLGRLANMTKNHHFQRVLKGVTGVVFLGFGAKLLSLQSK